MVISEDQSPLIRPLYGVEGPDVGGRETLANTVAKTIHRDTGLTRSLHRYADWVGVDCATVREAVSMMRMLVAVNVLARREEGVLFVPINTEVDADGAVVSSSVALAHRLRSTTHV